MRTTRTTSKEKILLELTSTELIILNLWGCEAIPRLEKHAEKNKDFEQTVEQFKELQLKIGTLHEKIFGG